MKVLRWIMLEVLLLIAMCLCGTMVMKVFDILLSLGYGNIWNVGFKVGVVAWIVMLALQIFLKKAKKQEVSEAVE